MRRKKFLDNLASYVVLVMMRKYRTIWLLYQLIITFCILSTYSAYSNNITNATTTTDLVAFFKQAISTPPDVEKYVVSHCSIKSGLISYYSGARAGSNYFVKILSDSNELANLVKISPVAGRSGASIYGFCQNQVSYNIGSNAMTQFNEVMFQMTRQFLNMGISEIDSESVKWVGDTFSATLDNGFPRYGKLSVSNGLPFRLEISVNKESLPYKTIEYKYPNPQASLGGFPSQMLILDGPNGKLEPVGRVLFYSVQLAGQPLPGDFFSAAQFVGVNIIHTNIYSNSDIYVGNSAGRMERVPNLVMESGGYTNSRTRALVFLFFALSIMVPIVFFILQKKQKK